MKAATNSQLRITALWAFSEAFLGGILHGLKMPFSGLVLSAFAAISICALAHGGYRRGTILHATILVMIVKLTLSPHTPFTAYFAVFLQGAVGELVFSLRTPYRIAAYIVALFALMQSALQKIIVLTLLFGVEGWQAVDEFLQGVMQTFHAEQTRYSIYLVGIYLTLYFIAGLLTGHFASRLPELQPLHKDSTVSISKNFRKAAVKRRKHPMVFMIAFILLSGLIISFYYSDSLGWISSKPVKLIIRSVVLLIFWYFFLSPVLMKILKRWLMNKKNALSSETESILMLLPEMKAMVTYAWLLSARYSGLKRIHNFIKNSFRLLLTTPE